MKNKNGWSGCRRSIGRRADVPSALLSAHLRAPRRTPGGSPSARLSAHISQTYQQNTNEKLPARRIN